MEQKTVTHTKSEHAGMWLLGPSGDTSYLASQCKGQSGIDKDLAAGWIVKGFWEDRYMVLFLLERAR